MGGAEQLAMLEKKANDPPEKLPSLPAGASPEQRRMVEDAALLQARYVEMSKASLANLRRARDLADVRDKYSSPTVDYALKNGGEYVTDFGTWLALAAMKARKQAK